MSILKTLDELGKDPSLLIETLTLSQRDEIEQLKGKATNMNAILLISDPDPTDPPEPDPKDD